MSMKPLSLETIARVTGGRYVGPDALRGTCITGVVRDNRQVQPGNLFLCIRGARADGHSFAPAAYAAGAACCLAEQPLDNAAGPYILVDSTLRALRALAAHYRTLFRIPVVGVTGSVGKTGAKEMTAAVLSRRFNVLKTPENLNNEIGVPLTVLSLQEEHQAAVIEMGISDFGEMSRLADIVRPDICIMTNIGYCHLEALGDLEGVLRAKSEVFQFMKPDATAVVCGDDELLGTFDPGIRKITFGLGRQNTVHAENVRNLGFEGIVCDIVHGDSRISAHIPAFGSHMVLAALAAAAVGLTLGLSDEEIVRGIADFQPVGGRANVRRSGYITVIDDCYNANPNSVSAALLSLAGIQGRRVAVLGDMLELGTNSDQLHRDVGVLVGKLGIDALICCGKSAEFIYKGLISTGIRIPAWHFPMKEALLHTLPSLIRRDDTVLVKASHGMHFEELVRALLELQ